MSEYVTSFPIPLVFNFCFSWLDSSLSAFLSIGVDDDHGVLQASSYNLILKLLPSVIFLYK